MFVITWARVFLPEQRLSKREVEALSRRERLAAGDEREPAAEILSAAQDLIPNPIFRGELEARAGIEPAIEVLQTSALPLGYRATEKTPAQGGGWKLWSGRRDLNPRLRPWQGRTLPLSYSRSAASIINESKTRGNRAQTHFSRCTRSVRLSPLRGQNWPAWLAAYRPSRSHCSVILAVISLRTSHNSL